MEVRQDSISKTLVLIAYAINIFLITFDLSSATLFPALLLIGSIALYRFMWGEHPEDPYLDTEEVSGIGWFTVVALFGVMVGSWLIPNLYVFIPSSTTLSGISSRLGVSLGMALLVHTTLMAIAEEQFFRGVFMRLWSPLGFGMTILLTSLAGVIYHFAVYGSSGFALLYVMGAWATFTYVALRIGRISPLIIAHLINNWIAVGLLMKPLGG